MISLNSEVKAQHLPRKLILAAATLPEHGHSCALCMFVFREAGEGEGVGPGRKLEGACNRLNFGGEEKREREKEWKREMTYKSGRVRWCSKFLMEIRNLDEVVAGRLHSERYATRSERFRTSRHTHTPQL